MGMTVSRLDRRIQFRRRTLVDDGHASKPVWADHGSPVFGNRRDVSGEEKAQHGRVESFIHSLFTVRATAFTQEITPAYRLSCQGQNFNIISIRQVGERGCWLEISGRAEAY